MSASSRLSERAWADTIKQRQSKVRPSACRTNAATITIRVELVVSRWHAIVASSPGGRTRLTTATLQTVAGATEALTWADAIMVEYHLQDASHADVIALAASRGLGVVVKKGLASGHLPAVEAIRFVLSNHAVSSVIVGGLSLVHLQANIVAAGIA